MKIGSAFPSQFLKAEDLNDSQVTVSISHVETEPVGRDKQIKPVLYFQGKEKGLVLNATNAKKITSIAGTDETTEWTGVRITLYPTEVEYAGETVPAIRVKAPVNTPKAKPAPAVEHDEDPIPF